MAINLHDRSLPGQRLLLVSVLHPDIPEQDPASDNPGGSAGMYSATFVLNRAGYPLDAETNTLASELLEGDSHLFPIPQSDYRFVSRGYLRASNQTNFPEVPGLR